MVPIRELSGTLVNQLKNNARLKLELHGLLFDVGAAELHVLDHASGEFQPVPQIRPRLRSSLPPLPVSE